MSLLSSALSIATNLLKKTGVMEDYFKDENLKPMERCGEEGEDTNPLHRLVSPSGKYELKLFTAATKPGSWNCSVGQVWTTSDAAAPLKIAQVNRNYHAFPFAWVQQGDEEYLVCGEDYQGITVVRCGDGHAVSKVERFCHAEFLPSPNGKFLYTSGCHWACPYESKVYDIQDILKLPWPLIGWNHEDQFSGSPKWSSYTAGQLNVAIENTTQFGDKKTHDPLWCVKCGGSGRDYESEEENARCKECWNFEGFSEKKWQELNKELEAYRHFTAIRWNFSVYCRGFVSGLEQLKKAVGPNPSPEIQKAMAFMQRDADEFNKVDKKFLDKD